ncbi:N,N-dimethylformamidase beta subunit family domain-containing protein [Nocardioides sp. BYT-33-1]|uniref:N,N-dimethylformamidase beta subunit family domain-containing protein n=1 Tax=Nocardioides sp. BYT-33-1 TaxID=3416952 RepID=UPI003F53DEEE
MSTLPVRAYADALSYERGGVLRLHVSATGPVDVRLIRMRSADAADPALDADVAWAAAGAYDASPQETCVGSFLVGELAASAPPQSAAVSLGAFVWSTDHAAAPVQALVSLAGGPALELRDGCPAIVDAAGVVLAVGSRMADHTWHLVVASLEPDAVRITVTPVDRVRGRAEEVVVAGAFGPYAVRGPVTVGARDGHGVVPGENGARGLAADGFNGKLEDPFVSVGAVGAAQAAAVVSGDLELSDLDLVAAWDLSFRHGEDPALAAAVAARQPHGTLVNGPARGVTGRRFTGRALDYSDAPGEYAAVHVHSTDLNDAGWDCVLEAALPEDLESGVYGVVVENADGSDVVPITVVPRADDPRSKVLVVLPTFTYLAYANEALFNGLDPTAMTDQEVVVEIEDEAHVGDASFGLSMYDTHPDGSGVMLSSARRQIVNMRRGYRMWLVDAGRSFSSDMYLVEWLARRGIACDVVTDLEVHERGAAYLAPYAAVISGSHPEYTSEEMLDALTDYRDGGGGLLYLGGNGWYWVTGVLSTAPLVTEIRRGHAGIRCWESQPGELTLMSTGLPGGLWRHRGRAPQVLSGVGFAAQGWGRSEPYYRSAAAGDRQWAWVFEGVEDDPIGAYGAVMGGAAGDEIDRADVSLGTPEHAVVLASSRGHSNFYQRVLEEIGMNLPDHGGGEQDPEVHADIVYFRTPEGGEVFSTGSIAWSGALLENGTENGVSRMTENVVRAFVARRAEDA